MKSGLSLTDFQVTPKTVFGNACHCCNSSRSPLKQSNPDQCRRRIRSYQEKVFIKLLLMGKTKGLPAIIHCKDTGDGAAAARALELITQLNACHCCNSSRSPLKQCRWNLITLHPSWVMSSKALAAAAPSPREMFSL
jgi:Fe-S cluster biogenesis protein NfuA